MPEYVSRKMYQGRLLAGLPDNLLEVSPGFILKQAAFFHDVVKELSRLRKTSAITLCSSLKWYSFQNMSVFSDSRQATGNTWTW